MSNVKPWHREVLKRLQQIEREEDVRILWASESGSRAWGFESPDSDWDVRFVYVRPVEYHIHALNLVFKPRRDVIEIPAFEVDGRVYDISGWDLKKALHLFTKGNAVLREWMSSPIIYHANREFMQDITKLDGVGDFKLYSLFMHYRGLAKDHIERHVLAKGGIEVSLKKLLYALRCHFAAWRILYYHEHPEHNHSDYGTPATSFNIVPMMFHDLLDTFLEHGCQDVYPYVSKELQHLHKLSLELIEKKVQGKAEDDTINLSSEDIDTLSRANPALHTMLDRLPDGKSVQEMDTVSAAANSLYRTFVYDFALHPRIHIPYESTHDFAEPS